MAKTGIVLFNLGGPDSLNAVEPFLANLFNDRDIFKLPFQNRLSKFIAKKRAPKIIKEYELIGGSSPLICWTELQAKALKEALKLEGYDADVFIAMRYWKPLTAETAKIVEEGCFDKVFLLPLYPHFSVSTTGSSFNEWTRVYTGNKQGLVYINDYFDNEKYAASINKRIDEALLLFPEEKRNGVQLVFSAHGTPVSYVKKGDPYSGQIKKTVELVMKQRNNSHKYCECFQSKVGPVKWLTPSTKTMIEELAAQGEKSLLIIPISFVSDHLETLFELNIQYRELSEKAGIENYIVMQGLNDSELFIEALTEIIKDKLQKGS
jgi:protoporphyrin/coproporphyrin ferrochelatase